MALDYEKLMSNKRVGTAASFTQRDTILYALGVGYGRDPVAEDELPFVFEGRGLKAAPTMGAILAKGFDMIKDCGVNMLMGVHGEDRLEFHKPIPDSGDITIDEQVVEVHDKGEGKGAIILYEKIVREAASGEKICTVTSALFQRGDGGFGGSPDSAPAPHTLPERAPDLVLDAETRPDQALLYAMSGDRNPLHRDPAIARKVGYERPILHGLCTLGTVGRALVGGVCEFQPERMASLQVRFSAPVYPGDTITTEIWRDGKDVSFRSMVKERDKVVLNNGLCTLHD